jgi:hypothetical protein
MLPDASAARQHSSCGLGSVRGDGDFGDGSDARPRSAGETMVAGDHGTDAGEEVRDPGRDHQRPRRYPGQRLAGVVLWLAQPI